MEQTTCIFCNNQATRDQSQFAGELCYKCENCGTYRVMKSLEYVISKYTSEEKNIIAQHLSENKNLIHNTSFVVTEDYIEKILNNNKSKIGRN